MSAGARYDTIGRGYGNRRRADPRIEHRIWAALGDAASVVNVGAGAGSYEPCDRQVTAVEPSAVMLSQRGDGMAPVVQGVAEALPFPDRTFDASLTSLTIHHWADFDAGLAELQRVATRHVVFTFDYEVCGEFWGWRDYFPDCTTMEEERAPHVEHVAAALGADRVEVVPVPWDCTDGFGAAYWRRPDAYLDPAVRASISSLAAMDGERLTQGVERLRADLESGEWARRNAELLDLDEADFGYRLIVAG